MRLPISIKSHLSKVVLLIGIGAQPSIALAGPSSYTCTIEGFKVPPAEGSELREWVGEEAMKSAVGIDRATRRVTHPTVGNTGFDEINLLNTGSQDWSFKVVATAANGGHLRYYEVSEYFLSVEKPFLAVADGILYWDRVFNYYHNSRDLNLLKFISRIVGLGFLAFVGYSLYDAYRAGYFDLPDMPVGSYQISFASGLRGIILDAEVSDPFVAEYPQWMRRISQANPDRRYLGIAYDVPVWLEGRWSYCTRPTDAERAELETHMPEEWRRDLIGARFDAVCRIDLDNNDKLTTGLIFSVPQS